MKTAKRVLCEQRLRKIPAQFSWIDQRLVFEGHLRRCDAHAARPLRSPHRPVSVTTRSAPVWRKCAPVW